MRVVIDIETVSDPNAFDREVSYLTPPKTYKQQEAIDRWMEKQKEALREKMAAKNSAHIMMIGIKIPCEIIIMHQLSSNPQIDGIKSIQLPDELSMMTLFYEYIESLHEPEFVTFNGANFDFPKLRLGMARHNISVPEALFSSPHKDMMWRFHKKFSVNPGNKWPSMKEVADSLGLPNKTMNGADFYKLAVDPDKHETAILYNAIDLILTEMIHDRIK